MAVIGAGAAGLAAARELTREGHAVVVFEQGHDVGGVWVYDDANVDDDGFDRARQKPRASSGKTASQKKKKAHSGVYKSLRTNLPREVMGYGSFPFTRVFGGDSRRFCGHEEVRAYLDAYADHHSLRGTIRFRTRVVSAAPVDDFRTNDFRFRTSAEPPLSDTVDDEEKNGGVHVPHVPLTEDARLRWGPRWVVTTDSTDSTDSTAGADAGASTPTKTERDVFDALVVCNGHYSEPRIPVFPGSDLWPGFQMHSHAYREPFEGVFGGKKIVVLGAMASGEDVSREIAAVASEVLLSSRGYRRLTTDRDGSAGAPNDLSSQDSYPANIRRVPGILKLIPETSGVVFEDGSSASNVDGVVYATGYRVTFPFFLRERTTRTASTTAPVPTSSSLVSIPTSHENRVSPLFEHVFPPGSAPSLSFVGLPWKVVPFPQFEAQARWIAAALSGAARLPARDEMARRADAAERADRENGLEDRHAHRMGDSQFAYNDRLLGYCGERPMAEWRERMYARTGARKRAFPDSYRDPRVGDAPWNDERFREEARAEALRLGFANDPLDGEKDASVSPRPDPAPAE